MCWHNQTRSSQLRSYGASVLEYSFKHRNITTVVLSSFLGACFLIMDRQSDTRHRSRSPRRLSERYHRYECRTCGREYFSKEKIKYGQWWGLPFPVSVIRTPRRDWVAADGTIVTSSRMFVCRVSCDLLHDSGCADTRVEETLVEVRLCHPVGVD